MAVPTDVGKPTGREDGVRLKEKSLVIAFLMRLDYIETVWLDTRYPQQAAVACGNKNNQEKIGLIFRSPLFFFF